MIAFVGSVFSPWYARARRRGDPDPEHFVSINVAVYDPHGGWAMTERGRPALARDAASFHVGPSRLERRGTHLLVEFDEVTVPLPRRLRGRIAIGLPDRSPGERVLSATGGHVWRPFAPAARMEVELDGPARRWSGDAYVDHNRGDEPLEARFRGWTWSRASAGAETVVVYATRPRDGAPSAFATRLAADGTAADLPVPPEADLGRTGWRISRTIATEDPSATRLVRTLEDTPFYARSQVRFALGGAPLEGIHESLDLDRFRHPLVQAMLPFRMPRRPRSGLGG